jgi:hypothetical protein
VLYGDIQRPAEMPGPSDGRKPNRGNKSRTEECKGTLSPVGNRASSVKV